MDRRADQLLARAGLAVHQHRRVAVRIFFDMLFYFYQSRTDRDDVVQSAVGMLVLKAAGHFYLLIFLGDRLVRIDGELGDGHQLSTVMDRYSHADRMALVAVDVRQRLLIVDKGLARPDAFEDVAVFLCQLRIEVEDILADDLIARYVAHVLIGRKIVSDDSVRIGDDDAVHIGKISHHLRHVFVELLDIHPLPPAQACAYIVTDIIISS